MNMTAYGRGSFGEVGFTPSPSVIKKGKVYKYINMTAYGWGSFGGVGFIPDQTVIKEGKA